MNTGYLVQGLRSNTLVAGKTTALRLVTAPWPASGAAAIQATMVRPDGSVIGLTWSASEIVSVDVGGQAESVVVLIPGRVLPDVGGYYLRSVILTAIGGVAATYVIDGAELLPTKDLRMMVSRVWSGQPEKPGEVQAARDAMTRLATLYPVRDGISTLDGDYTAGLRYDFDNNPSGPPNQDGNLGPSWDPYQHPPAGRDSLDAAVAYRFPNPGEGSGASTRKPYNGWLPWSLIVWQEPIAHVFSHETGHNHGLEPPSSPHFDPTGQASHSKDRLVDPADASGGFDVQFNQSFPGQTLDLMFPSGSSPGEPPDTVSLNSYDWEFVRRQLMARESTGPERPYIRWQSLGGHDLRPGTAAARNRDGRLQVFVIGGDRKLYHISEGGPGGEWNAWSTLNGHDLASPVLAKANADGRIQVFVVGGDGKLYSRTQAEAGGNWDPWTLVGGQGIKGFSVAGNANGRLSVAAVFGDGQLHEVSQVAPGGTWNEWLSLAGHDLRGPVALAANEDGRLEAFVVGGDGNVYHRWQEVPNGSTGWSPWANLIDARIVNVVDLRAERAGDGRIFVIMMTADKSISYLAQSAPNGDWGAALHLYGHDLRWPCGVGRADDGRIEVAVIGGDRQLYSRWQVDPMRSDLWVNWTPLGGREIQAGVTLAADSVGQLELFVIGGDGVLYRGRGTR